MNGQGKEVWRFKTNGGISCRPALHEGVVYFTSIDNNLYGVSAEAGKLAMNVKTNNIVTSTPLLKDGMLYFNSGDANFYAISLRTRKVLWKFTAGGSLFSSPVEHRGRLFFGGWDSTLYCIDLQGNLVWKFKTSMSSPARINVTGQQRARVLETTYTPEAAAGEERYKQESLGQEAGVASKYAVSSKYVMESKYTKGRKIKSLSSGWED